MSPPHFYFNGDDSRNANNDLNFSCSYPPPLGVSKVSHCIKKLSASSSSSLTSSLTSIGRNGCDPGRANNSSSNGSTNGKAQHRHPVIIYTNSPKIIQTHPRDFMALVQKLTGLSQSEDEDAEEALTLDPIMEGSDADVNGSAIGMNGGGSEDADASSVVTEEYGISRGGDQGQVNSSFTPSVFDRLGNRSNISVPFYMPNNSDFLCSKNQPAYYFGYPGLLNFIPNNNMTNPFAYSNFKIGINDLGDFSNSKIDF